MIGQQVGRVAWRSSDRQGRIRLQGYWRLIELADRHYQRRLCLRRKRWPPGGTSYCGIQPEVTVVPDSVLVLTEARPPRIQWWKPPRTGTAISLRSSPRYYCRA